MKYYRVGGSEYTNNITSYINKKIYKTRDIYELANQINGIEKENSEALALMNQLMIKSQKDRFKNSKLEYVKLSSKPKGRGVWSTYVFDALSAGIFVDIDTYESVFEEYQEYFKTFPVVQGRENNLFGYVIAPYFGYSQNDMVDMEKSSGVKKDSWKTEKYNLVFKQTALEDKPPLFSLNGWNWDFGETSGLTELYVNEEITEKSKKLKVKCFEVNIDC